MRCVRVFPSLPLSYVPSSLALFGALDFCPSRMTPREMEARQSVADNTTPHSGVPHLSVRVHVFNDTSAVLRINFKQLPMLPNEVLEECLEHACWGTLVEAKATSRAWREAATAVLRRRRRLVSRVLVHPAQRQHLPTVWLEAALRNQPLDKFLADTREVILRGTRWELHARYAVKKYRSSSGLHEIVKAVDRATDVRVDVHRIHGVRSARCATAARRVAPPSSRVADGSSRASHALAGVWLSARRDAPCE
jgi:hypothetical protein